MLPDINNDDIDITEDVDAYEEHADGLMDALFGEVEHILSLGNTVPRSATRTLAAGAIVPSQSNQTHHQSREPANQSKPRHLLPPDTVSLTKLDLPALSIPPISDRDLLWLDSQADDRSEMVLTDTKFLQGQSERTSTHLLDRVVAIAACTSVIFAAGLWTFKYGLADLNSKQTVASAPPTQTPDTTQFAEEVKQLFIAISNKEKEKTVAANNGMQLLPNIPGLSLPLNINGQLPGVLSNPQLATSTQPVYIPVYQPPAPVNPSGIPLSNTPAPAIAPVPNQATVSQPAIQPAIQPNVVASKTTTTLIGILDVGDRSSAMFDVNGSVQSVFVGDQVAGSGWVLSRITQQEAILKRGNESKSIFVGQKF